mgnify:CR=1 FL=1
MRIVGIVISMMLVLSCLTAAGAEQAEKLAEIAAEKAARTSDKTPSWDLIFEKLDSACSMLNRSGLEEGFKKMQGDSPYVFKGTYLWVHDLNYIMRMHPMQPDLVGQNIKDFRDTQGKLLFQDMNERVQAVPGRMAFVDYYWPKPGVENRSFPKRSVIKICEVKGEELIIGCGIYLDK